MIALPVLWVYGASGVGKTTVIKLLLGLISPTRGHILADGVPIDTYGLSEFRGQIGTMMQHDVLFSGSIATNIAADSSEISLERVRNAARLAHVAEDIERLPMGYESLVGEIGSVLSGGQKQRVMLARALYRKPSFLVMDEGTANLDDRSERAILETLRTLRIGILAVSHSPALLACADRVLVLRNGVISESAETQKRDRVQSS